MELQWGDFDRPNHRVFIRRGVVNGRIGDTKTEASRKELPVDSNLADTLLERRRCQTCVRSDDWVFGNRFWRPRSQQVILRRHIKPAALRAGVGKIGWHTFRHSYSTLLRGLGADIKVQQELLRHSTVQSTMNPYTQAVSEQKRIVNSTVVDLLFGSGAFALSNGNQRALTAARLAFIESLSSDCYCGA